MGVKVYVSGISGNKEVKKRQQRVFMILESKHIPYDVVDITEPGKENEKDFMQNNSTSLGITVSDTNPRHPLPPQLFNDADYCGDYDQFDLANEIDKLEDFLKVEVPIKNNVVNEEQAKIPETPAVNNVEDSKEVIETNGISSSREASVESEKKSNGAEHADEEIEEDEVEAEESADVELENKADDLTDTQKDLNPSEEFIHNEQVASE